MATLKEREREFKKQFIAETACQLFKDRSFEAVTVQDIASAAECGKGTIYQFFTNKDEILYYIITINQRLLNKHIEEQCCDEDDILQALSNYLSLQYSFHHHYGSLLMSMYRRRLEDAVNIEGYYVELFKKRDRKIQLVSALIQRGINQGVIMEVDSHKMALILNNIVRGFWLGNLELDKADIDEAADLKLIKNILVKGILTEKGGAYFE